MTYESIARRAQAEQRYTWDIADAAFRRNLNAEQGQGSKSWQEQLAPFSDKLWETGVELAKAHKERQLDTAKEKALYEGIDGIEVAGQKDLDEHFKDSMKDGLKAVYKAQEVAAAAIQKGIPQEVGRNIENTTLVDRQLAATQESNQLIQGLPGYIQREMTPKLGPNGQPSQGLLLRKPDGSIIDITAGSALSKEDHAIAVKWLSSKYLKNNNYKKEFLRSIDYYDNVGKVHAGVQNAFLKRKNEEAEFDSRKRIKNFIDQNSGKLDADDLGFIINSTQTWTNDKGKPFSYGDSQDWLTNYVKDLAKVKPTLAENLIDDMAENGYTVGGVNHKFGKERILSLREFAAEEAKKQGDQDYDMFKTEERGLANDFNEAVRNADSEEKIENIIKESQEKYNKFSYAKGVAPWIRKYKRNKQANPNEQIETYTDRGSITQAEFDDLHPKAQKALEPLLQRTKDLYNGKKSIHYKNRVEAIKGLVTDAGASVGADSKLLGNVAFTTALNMEADYEGHFADGMRELEDPQAAHAYAMNILKTNLGTHKGPDSLKKNYYYQLSQHNFGDKTSPVYKRIRAIEAIKPILTDDNLDWSKPMPDVDFSALDILTKDDKKGIGNYLNGRRPSNLFLNQTWRTYRRSGGTATKREFATRLFESFSTKEEKTVKDPTIELSKKIAKDKDLYAFLWSTLKNLDLYPSLASWHAARADIDFAKLHLGEGKNG
tara:strand:+ start:3757 stop:5904 length:2148 start_codon:yes stop_codon:yes gene_type:complete